MPDTNLISWTDFSASWIIEGTSWQCKRWMWWLGKVVPYWFSVGLAHTQQAYRQEVDSMLIKCWAIVCDAVPTLNKHCMDQLHRFGGKHLPCVYQNRREACKIAWSPEDHRKTKANRRNNGWQVKKWHSHDEWVKIALGQFSAQSWQYRDKRKPEVGTIYYCPILIKWLQGLFVVHIIIDSTSHSRPLNNYEHCICTVSLKKIRAGRDSNLVPISRFSSHDRSEWVIY